MTILLETKKLTLQLSNLLLCNHLNMQIQAGEIVGILGPNGSGKTTLLHTLGHLLKPASGEVFLRDRPILSIPRKEIARNIGILFQNTQDIFPQTVWEVCYSGRYPHTHSRQDDIITQQALTTMDLLTKSKRCVQTLSGGERKRLNIAMLLTQMPSIYLLDEPTNHLDLHYQVKVLNHFKQLANRQATSVLMSLHDVNLAAHYCQKILLLFGNGEYILGPTVSTLTKENLSRLYQHPLEQIMTLNKSWWQPCFYT
jgi:iron complex transport system ATP-binding protein